MLKRLSPYKGGSYLALVTTPIGNLSEVSPRAKEELKKANYIYAEDTRNALRLLSCLSIEGKSVHSIRSQNEIDEGRKALERLKKDGGTIAYVSDAGVPGISDPGSILAAIATEMDIPTTVVQSGSAMAAAYALSGFPGGRFFFQGFLPIKGKERKETLEEIANRNYPTVIYESPNRIFDTLEDLAKYTGDDREISLSRELTKIHEETIHGTIKEILTLKEEGLRGEIAFVVSASERQAEAFDVDAFMKENAHRGKDAVQEAVTLGAKRKEAYASYLKYKY